MSILAGIDNHEACLRALSGLRLGVVTNHTGMNRDLKPTAVVLGELPGTKVVRLFSPEHGIWGGAPAGELVNDAVDSATAVEVKSLYGSSHKPSTSDLEDLDALVFDIQDIGVRYYTYEWTMAECMAAAARAGRLFFVLDRPNPIGGVCVEGNLPRKEFSSLVGLYPVAARHGMTMGELARYVASEFGVARDVTVVPLAGWRRNMWYDDTGLLWVPPSPNSTGLDMALLYSGMCLIEGTDLSEGRGTTQPFELFGAPWVDPFEAARELERRHLPGVRFRPTFFTPTASKHAGHLCGGVQVHITDRDAVRPFELGLTILSHVRGYEEFQWRKDDRGYSIDHLAGTDEMRLGMDAGATPEELLDRWAPGLESFKRSREKYLIYQEE